MGRKPLGELGKSYMLRIRMTDDERAALDSAAALAGKPTSTWARDLLLSAAASSVASAARTANKPASATRKPRKKPSENA